MVQTKRTTTNISRIKTLLQALSHHLKRNDDNNNNNNI